MSTRWTVLNAAFSVSQDDSHSHEVVSQMLTAVVPVWLAVEKDPTALLQVIGYFIVSGLSGASA